ncbi:MAG: sugar phosphate isomerase/epimerase [Caldilineaceae bacterium]|nr:sugar phosphate isomerase/epimerase [Caldilineaceae bacterium]
MKLGYSTWGTPTVPVDAIVRHLAGLGFEGVELTVLSHHTTALEKLTPEERRRIPKLLQEHNLELPAIAGHVSLMDEVPDSHAANLDRLKQTIDLAVEWASPDGPPAIDTTAGGTPEDWDSRLDMLVARLQEAADYAQARGVVIALEPHVGSIIDTPDRTLELLRRVGSDALKVNFDISHFNVMGFSIEESVSKMAPHAVHTHVKDERGTVPDFEFLIPGEGEFDYVTYLKSMQRYGYTGFITPEISNMVQSKPNYYPLSVATQTYQTMAQAFVDAGIERD